jgi:ubiquitin-conjugating enzyme E2 Q
MDEAIRCTQSNVLKLTSPVELSDYPASHTCMIFGPDNASSNVANVLATISAAGKTVAQTMELVFRKLGAIDGDGDEQMLDSQQFDGFDDEIDDDSNEEGEDYFPGDEEVVPKIFDIGRRPSAPPAGFTEPTSKFRQRIRRDLLMAKNSGFKVGHIGGLMNGWGCYVSLSIRVSKLGISGEAMRAWNLEPTEYLIVLFNYPSGYKNMDDMRSYDASQAQRSFGVRVGLSTTYKPTMQEAVQAFTILNKHKDRHKEESSCNESQERSAAEKGFRQSFISRPLDELLEQRFHLLLKYRYAGMPWSGAEDFYNEQISKPLQDHSVGQDDKYFIPEVISTAYPPLVTADHIQDVEGSEHSLPLVGMQFVLRHFVRCTEFCLICFSKMSDDLQAIKPYVCDNPLCLYQYMSLGFGPSIEHEILSQPRVVDLLVSFCCASARESRLRDFPSGLSLDVPPPSSYVGNYQIINSSHHYPTATSIQNATAAQIPVPVNASQESHNAKYNAKTNELLFQDQTQSCLVRATDWIVMCTNDKQTTPLHCRVSDTSCYPSVKLSEPVQPVVVKPQSHPWSTTGSNPSGAPTPTTSPASWAPKSAVEFQPVSFHIYNQNFDDLSDDNKRQSILMLLDVIPPVKEMKDYLSRGTHRSLSAWVDRIPPASLGILRWIIASNRACILQVDDEQDAGTTRKIEDRLYGMSGWAQFRFAMGAPDKERRFIRAVRKTSQRLNLSHPTLFAWHGSGMKNWHSIIREGLHFKDISHGRAYGNGVYHSLDMHTSLGYSGMNRAGYYSPWSGSELKIQQTLALNEIVNAPQEFVSQSPHLVIAQLDWIQTRYLFVQVAQTSTAPVDKGSMPLEVLEQDPVMTANGVNGKLVIPAHAISSRRSKPKRTKVISVKCRIKHQLTSIKENKRQKTMGSSKYNPIDIDVDDDTSSVATLDEDLAILEDDELTPEHFAERLPTPSSNRSIKGNQSMGNLKWTGSKSYVPGMLDYTNLPILQQPEWASTVATKCLMRDFKNLIETQNKWPLHELGWHIDEDKIENMYQWIVELHSFDPALPLTKDMEKRDIKSVVLELRFGKEYPMSPPFVRVIRPRFLSFAHGGGGNVTAGGAMCMELLTNDGWSAVSSIDSVLLQVRVAITSPDRPARLDTRSGTDYGVGEAVEAYMRACAAHGWTVPVGFKEMAYGGAQALAGT